MGDLGHSSTPSPPLPPSPGEVTDFSYHVLFEESNDELPEPLPTVQDIINCPENITTLGGRRTKRISLSYFVKYGTEVTTIEAENMRFIRQNSIMQVPRVYAVYRRQPTHGLPEIVYIIMENIEGVTLQSAWETITAKERLDIATKLKASFDKLRNLRNPTGLIESIGGLNLQDDIFKCAGSQRELCGPFESEDSFISSVIAIYRLECGERMAHRADYYDRILRGALATQQPPVFTHNDLQRKNIMLTPVGDLVVLDWAASGWYPPYWEYSTALFACGGWNDDWYSYVSKILDEYPTQYIWLNVLRLEMWT